jgi:hypothetical protein
MNDERSYPCGAALPRPSTIILKTGRWPAPFEDARKLGGPTSRADLAEWQSYHRARHTATPRITIGISTSHVAPSMTIEDASPRIGSLIAAPVRSVWRRRSSSHVSLGQRGRRRSASKADDLKAGPTPLPATIMLPDIYLNAGHSRQASRTMAPSKPTMTSPAARARSMAEKSAFGASWRNCREPDSDLLKRSSADGHFAQLRGHRAKIGKRLGCRVSCSPYGWMRGHMKKLGCKKPV